jgi:transcriptional regulator with XRE-family HTH domain
MTRSTTAGELLREWRSKRRVSQFDLAVRAGVSPRHLSFVETGRSRPSPELLLTLARHLDVPLRSRNRLLLAAGHAPRYNETPLDDPAMAPILASLQRMLTVHEPYPGIAIDRGWNVVLANNAALRLVGLLPDELTSPPINIFRACLHPNGLSKLTTNFERWAHYLLDTLQRAVSTSGDPAIAELEREILNYPNVVTLLKSRPTFEMDEPNLLIPFNLHLGTQAVSLFTTITTFGTPRDITLDDLAIELFFPADQPTTDFLRTTS